MREVRCATKAFIMDNGKLLVIKQAEGGKEWWDMPGGKLEFGLTPEENLKKEVMEEVGLEVEIEKLMGVSQFISHGGDQVVCIDYLCRSKGKNVDIGSNPDKEENIVKALWITPEEFFAQLSDKQEYKGLRNFIKKYFLAD